MTKSQQEDLLSSLVSYLKKKQPLSLFYWYSWSKGWWMMVFHQTQKNFLYKQRLGTQLLLSL